MPEKKNHNTSQKKQRSIPPRSNASRRFLWNWRSLSNNQAVILAAVIAAVPTTISTITAYQAGKRQYTSDTALTLAMLFGEKNGKPRAKPVARERNDQILAQKFSAAKQRIRIVTETGWSWLLGDLRPSLEDAVSRGVTVEVLLLDFRDKRMFDAIQRTMRRNDLQTFTPRIYAESAARYLPFFDAEASFTVGLHRAFLWSRFTLFDDDEVSFVLTPILYGGSGVQPFFSDDRLVYETFETLYVSIREGSTILATKEDFAEALSHRKE